MKELVCIVCPNGCKLTIDGEGSVENAKCPKGVEFATEEMTNPMRTVCSTVATTFPDFPVLPVRTSQPIPKSKIPELMVLINAVIIKTPLSRGEVILEDLFGSDADLISSSSMNYSYHKQHTEKGGI